MELEIVGLVGDKEDGEYNSVGFVEINKVFTAYDTFFYGAESFGRVHIHICCATAPTYSLYYCHPLFWMYSLVILGICACLNQIMNWVAILVDT